MFARGRLAICNLGQWLLQLARLHDDLPSTPQRSSQPLTPTAANGNVAEAYLQLYEQTVQKSFDFAKQVTVATYCSRHCSPLTAHCSLFTACPTRCPASPPCTAALDRRPVPPPCTAAAAAVELCVTTPAHHTNQVS